MGESDAGCLYGRCCCNPHGNRELGAGDAKAAQAETKTRAEAEIVEHPVVEVGNGVVVGQADEILIEGEEPLLSQRGVGKCGCCALSTDVNFTYLWGLFSL